MTWVAQPLLPYKTDFHEPPVFNDPEQFNALMLEVVEQGGSDVYIQSGYPVLIKLHGNLRQLTERRIPTDECLQIINFIGGNEKASGQIAQGNEFTSSYSARHAVQKDKRGENQRYRFRANGIGGEFRTGLGVQVVMRAIRSSPPSIDELDVDPRIIAASTPEDGSVIISGATGSGKSTTFAGMLHRILTTDTSIQGNIVLLEKPIEYVFDLIDSKHSVVFQAEIGRGVSSFAQGIISMMRHDPSLIVVGETRDEETASAVMAAANTGHPVYTTIHANNGASIFTRLLSFYEPAVRDSMLYSVVNTTRLLVNQRLVPSLDGKRVSLREFLVVTDALREEITHVSDPKKIASVMTDILARDGVTMAKAAENAYERGLISEATMKANRG